MFLIEMKQTGCPVGVMKRDWNKWVKAANLAMGSHWHENFKRKHFTDDGAREYGYTPRKGQRKTPGSKSYRRSYWGRKVAKLAKQGRRALPLVLTGDSRRQAMSQKKVVATSKLCRVKINAPGLNRRAKGSKVNMREEMTTVTRKEFRALWKVHAEVIRRAMNATRASKVSNVSSISAKRAA